MKKFAIHALLTLLIVVSFVVTAFAQKAGTTLVNVRVTDASSGKANRNAKITMYLFQGKLPAGANPSSVDKKLFLDKQTGDPDNEGRITFQIDEDDYPVTVIVVGELEQEMLSFSNKFTTSTKVLTAKTGVVSIDLVFTGSDKGVFVHVTDQENNNALANAKVTIKMAYNLKDLVGYTDGFGSCFLEVGLVEHSKTYNVVIEKKGYKPISQTIELTDKKPQYSLEASLEKDKNTKLLTVKVLSDDDNAPLNEVSIKAEGRSVNDFATGQTNGDGIAELVLDQGGEYTVTATHPKFRNGEQKINIKMFDEPQAYSMDFKLMKKGTGPRDLYVHVREEYEPGKMRPRQFAEVSLNDLPPTKYSDEEGVAKFSHSVPVGQQIIIKASAYKGEVHLGDSTAIMVGGDNWRYFPPEEDHITLTLRPDKKEIKLKVVAYDADTKNILEEGTMQLQDLSGKPVSELIPIWQGSATITVKPDEIKDRPLRLIAKAANYEEQWSDVPAQLLTGTEPIRYYSITLKKKKSSTTDLELKIDGVPVALEDATFKISNGYVFLEAWVSITKVNGDWGQLYLAVNNFSAYGVYKIFNAQWRIDYVKYPMLSPGTIEFNESNGRITGSFSFIGVSQNGVSKRVEGKFTAVKQ